MPRELTEQEKKDYIEAEGESCPMCESGSFVFRNLCQGVDATVSQKAICRACGAQWIEHFTLTDITLEEEGDGDPVHR